MSQRERLPIAVIGAGSWGTALALVLARNGHPIYLWGHHSDDMRQMQMLRENRRYLPHHIFPDNLQVKLELGEALQGVRDVLIVVPSAAFRSVLGRLVPFISSNTRVVWGTKGLDSDSCETLDKVAQAILGPEAALAVLSGPSFASEVAQGLPTAVTLASNNEAFADYLVESFCNDTFRVYKTRDFAGVELCGVMKNVLAIAAGLCDGLKLGANARSALLTRGIAELSRLLQAAGGDEKTLLSLAGIGDIILTCTTDQSRNRRFGLLVGGGLSISAAVESIGQVVEGFSNVSQLDRLAKKYKIDMPIVDVVYRVLYLNLSPQDAAQSLLARRIQGKWESD